MPKVMSPLDTSGGEQIITKPDSLQLFTAGSVRMMVMNRFGRGDLRGIAMIEINDAKLSHYTRRIQRERHAAEVATSEAIRELHLRIAEMYERELAAIRSLS